MSEPVFTPSGAPTRLDAFAREASERSGRDLTAYDDLHSWSIDEPDAFWSLVWDHFDVVGDRGAVAAKAAALPEARFFPDATLNIVDTYLRAVPARDDAGLPIVVHTAETDSGRGVSVVAELGREDLLGRVAMMAAALRARGVTEGDRVALVLPVGIDALVTTLAGLAVGAVVTSAAPEFGVPAIVDRFGQLDPVVLIGTTSYRWAGKRHDRGEHLVELVRALPSVRAVLVVPGESDAVDVDALASRCGDGVDRRIRLDLLGDAQAEHSGGDLDAVSLPFDHPAYVLFSSGTTGKPKCLVHRAGGVLVKHLVEAGLHGDFGPGDRVCFYTTTGWMMWNWAISVLATGATLVLHDGAPTYPTTDALVTLADVADLTHLGLGARLLDAMRAEGLTLREHRDLPRLRMVLVTGSPLTEATARWLVDELGPTVMPQPISGGTDLVGCFVAGVPTLAVWPGEIPRAALGMDVDVYDDDGQPATDGRPGELVCRNTFPTVPLGIWGDDGSRLHDTYFARFPGVWTHGDLTSRTEHGGFVIHGRSDATLNVAGVRIGTGEIYAALEHVPEVVDALAFAQSWEGDSRMVLLVVLAQGAEWNDDLRRSIRATLRERGSPRHVPAVIAAVDDLPRTLTGKLAELAVANTVNGRPVRNRDALANPDSLDVIAALPELLA